MNSEVKHITLSVLLALFAFIVGMMLGRDSSPATNLGECYQVVARQYHSPSAGYEIRKIDGFTLYSCKDGTR